MDDLVTRALGGDATAFEALVRETAPSVRTVVISYVKNPEDASDVVQEVFLRAMQRLDTLEDPARFRPWIYQIARNAGIDHLRMARRRPVIASPVDNERPFEPEDVEPGPEALAELRELSDQVRIGLSQLGPRDATLLAMVCTLGFGPTDVAAALGMTPNAAKVAIHRARQRLRNASLLESAVAEAGMANVNKGCEVFRRLVGDSDLVEAAVHARGCAICGASGPRRAKARAGAETSATD